MATTPNQEAPSLEETLNKTDFGQMINENKVLIMIIGAVIVAIILGYSIFSHQSNEKRLEVLDEIYTLESKVFTPFLEDKIKSDEFISKLSGIDKVYIGEANLVPQFILALNKMDLASGLNQEVLGIAKNWLKNINKSNSLYLFLSLRVSAIQEDLGMKKEAIATLEGLVANKTGILKDKIHYDLTRLYYSEGDLVKAQERLKYIEDNYKDSQFIKLGKIILSGVL